ncbi:metallophosphoesterase [Roseovarius sp. SCSIO 43702]|uniref:metallophosphoesterase n=1 Tax=Roseovarius sp. SCSIO 43702 TaxID=2823043 RepID=UPI001C7338A5|nr:metallophosphoesterase [Roseovarius sp. SCSIO 43702]QYX56877.1 metallophosphoesterase [Roseovarius sp. SCSIO 43702]
MALGRFKSILGDKRAVVPDGHVAPAPSVETVLAPDRPFVAIGDVHGRIDLLVPMIDAIRAETGPDVPIVMLGDYIDRGLNSAATLNTLFERQSQSPESFICLMGNHEKMMLEFIDDPAGKGARWLVNGGDETLANYGVAAKRAEMTAEDAVAAADALEAALPEGLQPWLRALPLTWSSGNMHCVHAAMDPDKPPHAQDRRTLLWGHPRFLSEPRTDGLTIVHGHTVMAQPAIGDGRISLDTGAYMTGVLAAAFISGGDCVFNV